MGDVNAIRHAAACRRLCAAAMLAALAAACAPTPQPFPELPRLDVATQLTSRNLCGLGVSPAIRIANAPPATARYRLRMSNIDVLFQQPWQTIADATPGGLAEGALADYAAPCVGDLTINSFYNYQTYRLEVLALDAASRPLAYGQTSFPVQSIATTLDRERGAIGRLQPSPLPQNPTAADSIGPYFGPAIVPQAPGPVYQP